MLNITSHLSHSFTELWICHLYYFIKLRTSNKIPGYLSPKRQATMLHQEIVSCLDSALHDILRMPRQYLRLYVPLPWYNYSVVYMTLSWKQQWSKKQDTEKPKTSRSAHFLRNTLVHLVRCVYHNVKKRSITHRLSFIRHTYVSPIYLCITYISCLINFFGGKPFFGLVSVSKVQCNG